MIKNIFTSKITILALSVLVASCQANAEQAPKTIKCTPAPCANTPTGEDPEILEVRAGKKIQDDLRNNSDDELRWSALIVFSESSNKDDLTIPIIKSSKFFMTLDPRKGLLNFYSPQFSHFFQIDSGEPHQADEVCPNYQLRVLDGAPEYALVKKICPKREYEPKRFYMAATYYIYDMKSATMREVWSGSRSMDMKAPFPSAKPEITLKKTRDGYQFDWKGMSVSDNPPTLMSIHREYKRERYKDGKTYLVCYDTSRPQHPIQENGACESGILERVLK